MANDFVIPQIPSGERNLSPDLAEIYNLANVKLKKVFNHKYETALNEIYQILYRIDHPNSRPVINIISDQIISKPLPIEQINNEEKENQTEQEEASESDEGEEEGVEKIDYDNADFETLRAIVDKRFTQEREIIQLKSNAIDDDNEESSDDEFFGNIKTSKTAVKSVNESKSNNNDSLNSSSSSDDVLFPKEFIKKLNFSNKKVASNQNSKSTPSKLPVLIATKMSKDKEEIVKINDNNERIDEATLTSQNSVDEQSTMKIEEKIETRSGTKRKVSHKKEKPNVKITKSKESLKTNNKKLKKDEEFIKGNSGDSETSPSNQLSTSLRQRTLKSYSQFFIPGREKKKRSPMKKAASPKKKEKQKPKKETTAKSKAAGKGGKKGAKKPKEEPSTKSAGKNGTEETFVGELREECLNYLDKLIEDSDSNSNPQQTDKVKENNKKEDDKIDKLSSTKAKTLSSKKSSGYKFPPISRHSFFLNTTVVKPLVMSNVSLPLPKKRRTLYNIDSINLPEHI